jgi:hypothetical protein
MNKMRFAVAGAREILDASIRAANSGMTQEEKDTELKLALEQRNVWEKNTQTYEIQKRDLLAQLPHKGENVDYAIGIVGVAIDQDLEQCPVCSSHVGLDHLKQCQAFYEQQVNTWEEKSKSILEVIASIDASIESSNQNLREVNAHIGRVQSTSTNAKDGRAIPVSDAQSRLETAMSVLGKMENTQAQWENLANARNRALTMKAEVESYRTLKLACESAVGVLLGERAKDFSARVQKYLPPHWTFKIELMDGNKEVFRMGIFRDGKLHAALSGAEWTSIVTSIAMAVSEGLHESAPAILIPEDRAWDGKTLSAVLRSFSNFEGQVIMASTIRPTGRPPKGWTVIDMDQVSKSWCTVDSVDEEELPVEEVVVSKTSINHANGGFRVTSRSSLILEDSGFASDDIQMMSRDTVASIIRDGLSPTNVHINEDGGYHIVRSSNVLPMPPAPKA